MSVLVLLGCNVLCKNANDEEKDSAPVQGTIVNRPEYGLYLSVQFIFVYFRNGAKE